MQSYQLGKQICQDLHLRQMTDAFAGGAGYGWRILRLRRITLQLLVETVLFLHEAPFNVCA